MPLWDPLRGEPCFEKIVASLAPKENSPRITRIARMGLYQDCYEAKSTMAVHRMARFIDRTLRLVCNVPAVPEMKKESG